MRKLILLCAAIAFALPAAASEQVADHQAAIRKALSQIIPSTPDSIEPSGFGGLYEVRYGPQVFYVTPDGRYVFNGDVVDMKTHVNVTEKRRAKARVEALDKLGEDSMIIYKPNGKVKHTITVFTDIDCPYCRKLHGEIKQLNALGIRVRYLAYPRAGLGSPSYYKAVSVWCADNRRKAMDEANTTGKIEQKTCKNNPVKRDMALADMMGVHGTPAIVLEDGRMIPGYVPAQKLAELLNE